MRSDIQKKGRLTPRKWPRRPGVYEYAVRCKNCRKRGEVCAGSGRRATTLCRRCKKLPTFRLLRMTGIPAGCEVHISNKVGSR